MKKVLFLSALFTTLALAGLYGVKELRNAPPPAAIGGHYTLLDTKGNKVTDKTFHGKFQLIYFGYSYCPDVCPLTLERINEALTLLGPKAKKVHAIFITIDPERDSAEHLKAYLGRLEQRVIGLTGSPEAIKEAAEAFKVFYQRAEEANPSSTPNPYYQMDHSNFIYFMDKKGLYLTHFTHDDNAEKIAATLKKYL